MTTLYIYINLYIAEFSSIFINPFNIPPNIPTSEQRNLVKILN